MILKSNNNDSRFFSASIALAFDPNTAIVIQQLHYWIEKKQGKVIDGVRWIYNSYKDWTAEQFKFFSTWQLRQIFGKLKKLEIIRVKRHWAKQYNQTNFYTLDYDRLIEFVKDKTGVTLEVEELCVTTKGSEECPQNEMRTTHKSYTKTTSIKNQQIPDSPPTPSNLEKKESEPECDRTPIKSSLPSTWRLHMVGEPNRVSLSKQKIEPATDKPLEEQKEPRLVVCHKEQIRQPAVLPRGPWRSVEEFNLFYQALVSALPTVANARNADAVAKTVIKDICNGIPHSYWLDWKNGVAIGTTDKPEWEAEPGIPHPMFVEYLAEYLKVQGDGVKQAKKKAYDYLAYPNKARGLWREFKRDLEGVMARVEDAESRGAIASVPSWFIKREEVTIERATVTAGLIQSKVVSQDRLVLRHEVEQKEKLSNQNQFEFELGVIQREIDQVAKYGKDSWLKKAISKAIALSGNDRNKARLRKMLFDLYPQGLALLENKK